MTAQGLNYFKFGISSNLDNRVSQYKSILKNVKIRFQHKVIDEDYEKKCMNYLENDLGLHRDSEKFEYRDEEHLQ